MELFGVVIEFAFLVHPKRDGRGPTTVISADLTITGRHTRTAMVSLLSGGLPSSISLEDPDCIVTKQRCFLAHRQFALSALRRRANALRGLMVWRRKRASRHQYGLSWTRNKKTTVTGTLIASVSMMTRLLLRSLVFLASQYLQRRKRHLRMDGTRRLQ
jgi:hypothetical protein